MEKYSLRDLCVFNSVREHSGKKLRETLTVVVFALLKRQEVWKVVKNVRSGSKLPGFQFQLCHLNGRLFDFDMEELLKLGMF